MLAEVLSVKPTASGSAAADRPLARLVTQPYFATAAVGHWLWCRPNCYKLLFAIVLVFLLMQFTANFVAYKHKFTYSQSLAPNPVLSQWSLYPSSAHSPQHHIISRLVEPTVKQIISNSSAKLLSNNNFIKNSLNNNNIINNSLISNEIKRTLNQLNSETGSEFTASASNPITSDPIINFLNESSNTSTSSLDLCPLIPPKLVGRLKVLTESPPFDKLEELLPELEPGGRFKPKECISRHKMAIVIPYRDREEHLRTFLLNIHPMLERQQLDYGIYIVEEVGNGKFNRAKLMNIGFLEALKQYDFECFIFHDVDLIPEDDRNLYTCPEQPRHMSVAIDKFSYRLPYKDLFGGVSALTTEQFKRINGFSNEFWGWGGEDDDMSNRVRYYGYKISRYAANIARYKMLKHKGDTPNPDRYKKLYSGKRRYKTDGINNVKYKLVDLVFKKLYTWVLVDVLSP